MSSSIKKKERRRNRHLRNLEKDISHKKEAWESGKLIEENHNGGDYSSEYTIKLRDRLCDYIVDSFQKSDFLNSYRLLKNSIRDLILHYSPDVEKDSKYMFLKLSLETYWDRSDDLLITLKEFYDNLQK